MVAYKLTYFNVKALGEPIRYILSYAGADFTDDRLGDDWPGRKGEFPFGQVPVLEIHGKQAHQSIAICRYLARQHGLAGSNDWENLQIDMIVDTINDLRAKLAVAHYEADEAVKEKKFKALEAETIPYYLDKLDAIVKANDGHFALSKLTWADLLFAGLIDYVNAMARRDITANHANLKGVVTLVNDLPAIKDWIAKRPVTEY